MTTGMEGFAAQAGNLAGQAQGLRAAVDAGHLVMDPQAAERVARVYEDKADAVQELVGDARRLIRQGIYGNCFIGRGLEQKFNEKVTGSSGSPDAGLIPVLRKAEQILRDMAQAYRDSARDMQNTDEDRAHDLRKNV
ncbi:hypothetical protein GCM10011581_42600 [Saccharopolyspora subtropica]|uniref:Uncharacterized protein n=1 Tax=Saccharopolyspora thermophila TaxID=89367 RepID=A0A917NHE0_9PSEU|nr:hypothetical protein [Saccharopolyspora subtropica]GGJ00902.1 hypothetical protein GCM10011581_42600 [Saccharopolyspora subtropica]